MFQCRRPIRAKLMMPPRRPLFWYRHHSAEPDPFSGMVIEPMSEAWRRSPDKPWVLEPKALPAFIENARTQITVSDQRLAAFDT